MEELLTLPTISWSRWFFIAIILVAIFLVLRFVRSILPRLDIPGWWQNQTQSILDYALLLYYPVALLILTGSFILINPLLHSIITGLFLVLNFPYLRNYVSGYLMRLDGSTEIGNKLKIGDLEGFIVAMKPHKLHLQTNQGLHYINYTRLQDAGYTVLSADELGGLYHLHLFPKDNDSSKVNHIRHLSDLLAMAPYVNWNIKPQLNWLNENTNAIEARIYVGEEKHLKDLCLLVKEWGYDCKLQ